MYFIWILHIATQNTGKPMFWFCTGLVIWLWYVIIGFANLDWLLKNFWFRFPSKEDVLNYVVKITKNHLKIHHRTLVVVGAYSIGKECVYLAISKALGVCLLFRGRLLFWLVHSIHFVFFSSIVLIVDKNGCATKNKNIKW